MELIARWWEAPWPTATIRRIELYGDHNLCRVDWSADGHTRSRTVQRTAALATVQWLQDRSGGVWWWEGVSPNQQRARIKAQR